jgi:hypothetical protein
MKQLTRTGLHSHDWDTRASEALAEAKRSPPGSKRIEAIKKAGQLRVAADMKQFLTPKEPDKLSKIPASAETPRRPSSFEYSRLSMLDQPTDHSTYTKAELINLRRTMLLYCRSFPPGTERNQHWQIAQSLRRLFRNKKWLDEHTVEGAGPT